MQENEEQLVDFERLKQLVSERSILWREHALQRMNERRISKADVKVAILSGEVIEDYPDAYPTINRIPASGCQMEKRGGNRDEMLYVQRRFGARS